MENNTDISSKEFKEATKLHLDSILAIIQCQEALGEFGIAMNKYAISILEKLLKNQQSSYINHS